MPCRWVVSSTLDGCDNVNALLLTVQVRIYVLTYVYAACVLYCIKRVYRYNSRLSSSVNDMYVMCFIVTGNNEIHTVIF